MKKPLPIIRMFQLPEREFVVDETASKKDLLIVIDYLANEIEGMRERQLRRLSIPLPETVLPPYPSWWPRWIVDRLEQN